MKKSILLITLINLIIMFVSLSYWYQFNERKKENTIFISPIFKNEDEDKGIIFTCKYHAYDDFLQDMRGDTLGIDCFLKDAIEYEDKRIVTLFKNKGLKNEDWFTWNKDVLSPVEGKVVKIRNKSKELLPGVANFNSGIANYIIIETKDEIFILLAHLKNIVVKENDLLKKGDIVGKVGINGFSLFPHIHIGAWKEEKDNKFTPYQVIINQKEILNNPNNLFLN